MNNRAIELLNREIRNIEARLSASGGDNELIAAKRDYLNTLKMIQFIEKNDIDISHKVLTLPYIDGHGYYAYRIMIDNEVDDISKWTELKEIEGHEAEFVHGDKIITS